MNDSCRRREAYVAGLGLAAALSLGGVDAVAQVAHQVVIYGQESNPHKELVLRYDRKLQFLGATDVEPYGGSVAKVTPIAVDAQGSYWIAFNPLQTKQLLHLDSGGEVVGSIPLGHNPVNVVVDGSESAYALTRISLLPPGPLYKADTTTHSVLWSSMAAPSVYTWYPQSLLVTSAGQVWVGDTTDLFFPKHVPYITRINPADGSILKRLQLPAPPSSGDSGMPKLIAAGDGTMWAQTWGGGNFSLVKTDGLNVLADFPINGGVNDGNYHMAVDAHDRVYVIAFTPGGHGEALLRYDPLDPENPVLFFVDKSIAGFALGASGDEAFIVAAPLQIPIVKHLVRLNLRSGVMSSIPLQPTYKSPEVPYGDPTGFILANVIDQNGDNDGDGYPNRVETLATSNPFDASSRPNGPKVTISFAPNNAIILTYFDPDGLLHPTGGLDLSTLSLVAGNYGEVFPFLMSFLTFVDVQPDGLTASAVFGGLPLPDDFKLQLEATVADLSGANGWDWQVTPPGDL